MRVSILDMYTVKSISETGTPIINGFIFVSKAIINRTNNSSHEKIYIIANAYYGDNKHTSTGYSDKF